MGYKLIGYKEPDPLFEFFTIEDYEKFAEDPSKNLTEGLVPVYVATDDDKPWVKSYAGGKPNYTTPVDNLNINDKRVDKIEKSVHEWVGLTDEEIEDAMDYWSDDEHSDFGGAYQADGEYFNVRASWRYIEAKLKEKNG